MSRRRAGSKIDSFIQPALQAESVSDVRIVEFDGLGRLGWIDCIPLLTLTHVASVTVRAAAQVIGSNGTVTRMHPKGNGAGRRRSDVQGRPFV